MEISSVALTGKKIANSDVDDDAVAIVGIGCKLPGGVNSPASFWKMICAKKCGIKEVPEDRWVANNFYGKRKEKIASAVSKWAGFVDDIKSFDAKAFGISPREAASMDPQQRMLLESARNAVEDASIPLSEFYNTKTGVFVGVSQSDYKLIQEMRHTNNEIFAGTGYALCINANRISHRFGLTGPSYAVDTACSSSMVALDQALVNMKNGSCDMALVCGVNVMAHPIPFVAFSKAGMLSDTGVLSTFDANANGYVRGEGVGTVLLKRLRDAIVDNDDIYAVIEATSVNQDGYTTTLTAPNQNAQILMLESLLEKSGVKPDQIGFVEAHGTGTPVGDPIEAGAIGEAIGKKRCNGPVFVGSVKANIGHLESAAGISGLIKAALSIKHGKVAPNINFKKANPNIPMDVLNISVPTNVEDFPEVDHRRFAVVNSFGFGGTNASALLSSPPAVNVSVRENTKLNEALINHSDAQYSIFCLSSYDPVALRKLAAKLSTTISNSDLLKSTNLNFLTDAITRKYGGGNIRNTAVVSSHGELIKALKQIATEKIIDPAEAKGPYVYSGEIKSNPKVAFVYTGQGSQWWAMARQLLQNNAVFEKAVDDFDWHFERSSGWSIKAELLRPEAESKIDDTTVTQPALFAIQSGLSAVWKEQGIVPDITLGHSIGEVAAMNVAGGLNLESAASFLNKRGTIRDQLSAQGSMAALAMDADEVEIILEDEPNLCVAAMNAPGSTTITGDVAALEAFIERFEDEYPGVFIRQLKVDTAWHSHHLDSGRAWFNENMDELSWNAPTIPFISTVTGRLETCFDKAYGWENLRQPVNLKKGIEAACALGVNVFVEIGPHSTLVAPINNTCSAIGHAATVVNSLDRDIDDCLAFAKAAARLSVHGCNLSVENSEHIDAIVRALPATPSVVETFWKDSEESRQMQDSKERHPLLGMRMLGSTNQWKTEISLDGIDYLEDHRLRSDRLYPAAGYLEMLLAAGREMFGDVPLEITDTAILEALFIGKNEEIILHTVIDPGTNLCRILSHIRDSEVDDWTLRASGIVRECQVKLPKQVEFSKRQKGQKKISLDHLYDVDEQDSFVNYGPAFRTVRQLWMTNTRTSALIKSGSEVEEDFDKYVAHPVIIDGCLQITDPRMTLDVIDKKRSVEDSAYLPVGANIIRLFRPIPAEVLVHAEQYKEEKQNQAQGGFVVTDLKGNPVMQVIGLQNRKLPGRKLAMENDGVVASTVIEEFTKLQTSSIEIAHTKKGGRWMLFCNDAILEKEFRKLISDKRGELIILKKSSVKGIEAHWIADKISTELKSGKLKGIIYAWGVDETLVGNNPTTNKITTSVEAKVHALTWFGQALDEFRETENLPTLFVMTRNARSIDRSTKLSMEGLINAPQVALARTIASEFQEFELKQIDIDEAVFEEGFLEKILFGTVTETELVVRNKNLYVPRLKKVSLTELTARRVTIQHNNMNANFQVKMATPGILDNLDLFECEVPALKNGEVRVEVATVGLNFRDIMAATGLLPREAEELPSWTTLGLEFGAKVSKVGPGVKGIRVGDHVMGMAKSCLTRQLALPAETVTKIPKNISLADAATIPSAFATAYYALDRIGKLRKGEKILIHVATGGVGLAAIQIAKKVGAEIFATAGSDKKRRYLKKIGIKHVMNSRSLDFVDEIMDITDGKGVDVILNSLPDAYIQKGLSILAPYGRFLEIGKRDVYANSQLGMKALRKNVSFCVLDLAAMGHERPDLMGEMFRELVALFKKGKLKPLPTSIYKVSEVSKAFKFMSQAKHIGKVVISFDQLKFDILESQTKTFTLDRNATYLVTGGSRGFGVTVADWLSKRGARNILLTSRSGRVDKNCEPVINEIKKRGTKVISAAVDMTDEQAIASLIAKHCTTKTPLGGVIHGAAVIEDALLTQLDEELINRVIRPKVSGAWNLLRVMKAAKIEPDFFVNFSSIAQMLGSAGQGNYVAANAFLSALPQYLRGSGLNCKTVDWGVLGESGFVTRNDSLESYLDSVGMQGITNDQAINALEAIIRADTPNFLHASMDWSKIARANPMLGNSPRLAPLLQKADSNSSQLRIELFALDIEARTLQLQEFLCGELSNVLKVDAKEIPIERPMTELGLDSLSAFELKNRIEGELSMTLPISKFLQAPTVLGLSEVVSLEIEKLVKAELESKLERDVNTSASGSNSHAASLNVTDRQLGLLRASLNPLNSPKGRATYVEKLVIQVVGDVGAAEVGKAFGKIGKRHQQLVARINPKGVTNSEILTMKDGELILHEVDEIQNWPELDLENGELFSVAVKLGIGGSNFVFSAHVGILDRWSLHSVVQDFLLELSGEKFQKSASKKKATKKIGDCIFNIEDPISSGHRSFWYYATRPSSKVVNIQTRKRPVLNLLNGSAPGLNQMVALNPHTLPVSPNAIHNFLYDQVSAFGNALCEVYGTSDPIAVKLHLQNRDDQGASIVGVLDGEYPLVFTPSEVGGKQLYRKITALENHKAFDIYSYVNEFKNDIETAGSALGQFAINFRRSDQMHPLELQLSKGNFNTDVLSANKLAGEVSVRRSDIELDIEVIDGVASMNLCFDYDVVDKNIIYTIAKLMGKDVRKQAAE